MKRTLGDGQEAVITVIEMVLELGMVMYTCNPSTWGG